MVESRPSLSSSLQPPAIFLRQKIDSKIRNNGFHYSTSQSAPDPTAMSHRPGLPFTFQTVKW